MCSGETEAVECVCVCVCVCVDRERKEEGGQLIFKVLVHATLEPDKSKFCTVSHQAGDNREEPMLQLKSAGSLLTRVQVFIGDHQPFVLFRPLTDWKTPTSITEGDLLYSRSDDLNVHPIHRHPH